MTIFIINITETTSVIDLPFCKHEDLHLVWERKSVVETISKFLIRIRSIVETTIISSSIVAFGGILRQYLKLAINEVQTISERLIVSANGPSWRWRFQPWKKSSMDNEFDPPRQYPHIFVTGPIGESIKMINIAIHTRLPYIFKFKDKKDT